MVPVAEPAGDGAHRAAARSPRLQRGRSPTCTGSRRRSRGHFGDGSEFGVELSYSHEEELLGTAGGVRNVADFLGDSFLVVAGDALTDIDLTAMREFHESHDGVATLADEAGRRHRRVRGRDHRRRRARSRASRRSPTRPRRSPTSPTACIYMFRARDLRLLPGPGRARPPARRPAAVRRLGDGRLPGAARERRALLLARDRRLLERHRQPRGAAARGTSTPCAARSRSSPARPRSARASARPARSTGVEVEGPVLVGAGVEFGAGARIQGPAIVGDGCRIGDGACGARLDPARRDRAAGPRRCWSARSPVASPSPDAFLTVARHTRAAGAARSGHEAAARRSLSESDARRSARPAGARLPPGAVLCTRCSRRLAEAEPLAGSGPRASTAVWSSAAHEGVARDLVTALKFRRLLPVAELMADRIEWLAPASLLSGAIVPVPTALACARSAVASTRRPRSPRRSPCAPALALRPVLSRADLGRQLGRRRAERIGRPPRRATCAARRRAACSWSTTC